MSTSVQQINDLIASNVALKTFYETIRSDLIAARDNLAGQLLVNLWVDEINGLPGATGTVNDPLNSVDAALDRFRSGMSMRISLKSAVTMRKTYTFYQGYIEFSGNGGVLHEFRYLPAAENEPGRSAGFRGTNVHLRFQRVDVRMIDTAPTDGGGFLGCAGLQSVFFLGSRLTGGLASVGLVGGGGIPVIGLEGSTITNMAGKWISSVLAGATLTSASVGGIIDPAIVN